VSDPASVAPRKTVWRIEIAVDGISNGSVEVLLFEDPAR
jgi:hypothetical protein